MTSWDFVRHHLGYSTFGSAAVEISSINYNYYYSYATMFKNWIQIGIGYDPFLIQILQL